MVEGLTNGSASDIAGNPGFSAKRNGSVAVRHQFGSVGVTMSGETGNVWQDVKTSATGSPYRYTSVAADRSFGSNWVSVGMSRLDWEQRLSGETAPRRLIAALRFDRVLACKARNIDLQAPQAMLELVGIEFHAEDPPGGSALLLFSHGGVLRLDVECLECELTDLGTDDLGTGDADAVSSGVDG